MVGPFYSDAGITLYHGDCRLILPKLDLSPDLLLTDPPYGMAYKPLRGADGSKRWAEGVTGDLEPFDPVPLLAYGRCVLFGANHYADRLPPSGGWIVWDKTPRGAKAGFHASHAELAWTNVCTSVRKYAQQWGGEAHGGEPHLHPTQKPVGLMRWVLEQWTEPGDLVLDPYAGSGPIAEACRDLGRRYVGIELSAVYLAAAVRRLDQGVLFGSATA